MVTMRIPGALACIFIGAACAPSPTLVRVIDSVESDGSYETRDIALETIGDLRAVSGSVAITRGKAISNKPTGLLALSEMKTPSVRRSRVSDGDINNCETL